MQNVCIQLTGRLSDHVALMRALHERTDALRMWREVGGVELQAWRASSREVVIGNECGPNSARVTLNADMTGYAALSIAHEGDAEGMFAAGWVLAMARGRAAAVA